MDCIPAWLSPNHHCHTNIKTYNKTKNEIGDMIYENFIFPEYDLEHSKAEQQCKYPCKKMTNQVSFRGDTDGLGDGARLTLKFKKMVKVEKKVFVYTWFHFIVDVGSSLGLWLGLSALGITDLVIGVFLLAKNRMK